MEQKDTDDLRQELMEADDIDSYLQENQKNFTAVPIARLINQLYEEKNISKAALARGAGMSEVYLHQVFAGRRNPSRDRLLCLCIGLSATVKETQRLLQHVGYAQLYPRNRRDAIVLYGLMHQKELTEINDKLFEENEKTLF